MHFIVQCTCRNCESTDWNARTKRPTFDIHVVKGFVQLKSGYVKRADLAYPAHAHALVFLRVTRFINKTRDFVFIFILEYRDTRLIFEGCVCVRAGGGGGRGGVTSPIWHSTDVCAEWPFFSAAKYMISPFFQA